MFKNAFGVVEALVAQVTGLAKAVNLRQLVPQMLEGNVSHGVSVGLVLPGAEVTPVSNVTIVWFDLLVNLSFCFVGRECSCVVRGQERHS